MLYKSNFLTEYIQINIGVSCLNEFKRITINTNSSRIYYY
jgi:hypothetical protein